MDIWTLCDGATAVMPIGGELVRIVESQEQVATNSLVDSLEEQALLEQLLEAGKPPLRAGDGALHYLLSTPFRYPPLRHGSRFGQRHEPGIFYGAATVATALAETAYYRFAFWAGMTVPPPSGALTTAHTAFGAAYATDAGVRLQAPPFDRFASDLRHPGSYAATQALGTRMRAHGVLAFEFTSARDPAHGINVALFNGRALASMEPGWQQPRWQQSWLCETRPGRVTFFHAGTGTVRHALEEFLVDGHLPLPAF